MENTRVTAKDFFLWFGAMVALYWSVFSFISLIFSYLNYAFPDAQSYYYGDPYSTSISYEMASLLVLFPIFLLLMRIIRGDIARDPSRGQVWIRRWALVLTLFIAGVALAADLVVLIQYFFNGDVTLRFALKVLTLLIVAGLGFLHFYADLKGHWDRNPGRVRGIAWAALGVVIVSIVAGFFVVGTPWEARNFRYDDQKVMDLQGIQSQIVSYWQTKEELPESLADLSDPISGYVAPVDPQTGEPYEFRATSQLAFELCAEFNAPTQPYSVTGRYPSSAYAPEFPGKGVTDNWQHESGRTCFARTIDPERYPPFPKTR